MEFKKVELPTPEHSEIDIHKISAKTLSENLDNVIKRN